MIEIILIFCFSKFCSLFKNYFKHNRKSEYSSRHLDVKTPKIVDFKMNSRPKRKIQKSKEIPSKISRKWSDKEIETLLNCVMKYGHKNLKKIEEEFPGRSSESIKSFLRTAYDKAARKNQSSGVLDAWINLCNSSVGPPWGDSLQVAQVLKYLSVDGLIENHPLPASCQGVDFGLAYRLIYQALMGYPLQPVNKPTAEFVLESLMELKNEIIKQTDAIKNVELFFQKKHDAEKAGLDFVKSESSSTKLEENVTNKKPLRVYQRKQKSLTNSNVAPSLKITVEEKNCNSDVGSSKDFFVTVEGNNSSQSTIINVPVPCKVTVNEDEEKLLKSSSYNPFQIPGKWLEEPFHLNLILKL